jgi:hypothetical protein
MDRSPIVERAIAPWCFGAGARTGKQAAEHAARLAAILALVDDLGAPDRR